MVLSKSLLESKEINILSQDSAPVVFPVGNPCLYLLLLREPSSGRSARPFRPTFLSDISWMSQLSIRHSKRWRQAFCPEEPHTIAPLCPHTSCLTADSTGLIPVTQGSPHPKFLPNVPEGQQVRTGSHKATPPQLHRVKWLPTPRKSIPSGGWLNEGGADSGERRKIQKEEAREQAPGRRNCLWPQPVVSFNNKLPGDISSTISSLGKETQFCPLPKSRPKHGDIPGTSDIEGCFVFLMVYMQRPANAKKLRAEQWML